MIPFKAILISTAIIATALFLKAYAPTAVEISLFWSSFNSLLKPPYLLVLINVIITIIVASSSYYHSDEDKEIKPKPVINRTLEVKDDGFNYLVTFQPPAVEVERSEVVSEEKISMINGGDEVLSSKIEESSENLPPAEMKPLVSAKSDHRKPIKLSVKGGKRNKALKVVKQKPTFGKTWKSVMEELESTPLTAPYRRSQTFGVDHVVGEVKVKPALRKTVTFRDITNHQKSPMVKTPAPVKVKAKEEMLPSDEELNRRVEAFIKKTKQERLDSLRLDKKRSSLRLKV